MKKALAVLQLVSALLAAGGAASARAEESLEAQLSRRVDLEWGEIPKAKSYQIEIATDPEFTVPMVSQKTGATKFSADLLPGAYFYRVRAMDGEGFAGLWTASQELNINPRPPSPIAPQDAEVIHGNLPDTGLRLEWKSSGPGIRYLVEIKAADETGALTKMVVRQEVDRTWFAFFPQDVGKYQWTLHTLGAGGDEAGKSWSFTIEGVIPRNLVVPPGTIPKRIVRYVSPWWRGHWTLFTRYGQSMISYSIVDQDIRANSSFGGLTGYLTETLNWEWHDPVKWTGGGVPWFDLEVELDRQTVLSESVILPRHNLRFGAWYEDWYQGWRFSPFLEFGDQTVAVYQPRSQVEAARSNSLRLHVGLGWASEYQMQEGLMLGGSAKMKFEFGGLAGLPALAATGDQLDTSRRAGDMKSSSGLDLMLYGTMNFGPAMKLQGRLRYEKTAGSWVPVFNTQPSALAPDGFTTFSYTNIGFDVSVGIRF